MKHLIHIIIIVFTLISGENHEVELQSFYDLYAEDIDGQNISDITFDGTGCAISVASASLMTDAMKGKSIDEAEALFNDFHALITTENKFDSEHLGKLAVLAGVKDFPGRVKCASLCWHTLHSAIKDDDKPVSTE